MKKTFPGAKFGRLTVVERSDIKLKNRSYKWKYKCDCGNFVFVATSDVTSGHTSSCGCLQKEITSKNKTKHGKTNTRLFSIWTNMKTRCTNKNNFAYKDYGGRGITYFKEWSDFEVFYNWAIQNGYKENLTIERVDVNGNYEPSNCTFIEIKKQNENKRNTVYLNILNEKFTFKQLGQILNINPKALRTRYYRKQDILKSYEFFKLKDWLEGK